VMVVGVTSKQPGNWLCTSGEWRDGYPHIRKGTCLDGVMANCCDKYSGAVSVAIWLISDGVMCTMHVGTVCGSKGAG